MNGKGAPTKSLIWIGIALIGGVGGLLLGQYVVGDNVIERGAVASYADVTGNPHAPGPPSAPIEPCYDCVGSYGRGVRHDAGRETRMDDAFRELGAVEIDHAADGDSDYRYGGTFDDPDAARTIVMQSPVPAILPAEHPEIAPAEPIVDPSTPPLTVTTPPQ